MKECIFCKIVERKVPSKKVYEDKYALAFLDRSPSNLGHILVIPKKHFSNISEMPPKDLANLSTAISRISRAILKITSGMNIGQNNGKLAGQIVNHVHFHLIPRYENDDLKFTWKEKNIPEKENEEFLKKLKKYL